MRRIPRQTRQPRTTAQFFMAVFTTSFILMLMFAAWQWGQDRLLIALTCYSLFIIKIGFSGALIHLHGGVYPASSFARAALKIPTIKRGVFQAFILIPVFSLAVTLIGLWIRARNFKQVQ
ncbi:MAG: hypothetical protein KGI54_07660 [Pseudomonadota bacterium]|nr:hypothetical protein [Pseudomonadota bacterium]